MSKTTVQTSVFEIRKTMRRANLDVYRVDKDKETLFGILRNYLHQVEAYDGFYVCYLAGGKKK